MACTTVLGLGFSVLKLRSETETLGGSGLGLGHEETRRQYSFFWLIIAGLAEENSQMSSRYRLKVSWAGPRVARLYELMVSLDL